jgi:NAD(P)-dependent dehydrogenase (short-subunit alcohol dehydrogenase family)
MTRIIDRLFGVEGKRVLVTGGSRGIGEMIARGFVEAGARVYITSRKADACEATAAALSKDGFCRAIPADVSSVEGVDALRVALEEAEPSLDVLVNNAGATWGAPLEEYPEAGWDKTFATNVKGVFFLTQRLLPMLRRAGTLEDPARVINIGSPNGEIVPRAGTNYAYSASKAALHMLTRHLAAELGPQGITVNTLVMGGFHTKMMAFVFDDPKAKAAVEAANPLRRIGAPDDAAGTAIFLASKAACYVNGAQLAVDGGHSVDPGGHF